MTIETSRRLADLKAECAAKGCTPVIKGKEHKEDYVLALRNYWINQYYGSLDKAPFGLRFMLSIDCPQLCRRIQECKPEEQKLFWESLDYIAEEKIDGNRMLIIYDGQLHQFSFYSRNNSVKDFLPQNYSDKILVQGNFSSDDTFVLDCEVISTNPNLSTITGSNNKGVICATQLQATTALLALNAQDSLNLQAKDPLHFVVFDCLYHNEPIMTQSWEQRHKHAASLESSLESSGFHCNLNKVIRNTPEDRTVKRAFFDEMLENDREGVVLKNRLAPYHATTSRTRDCVKVKRDVKAALTSDMDAWVTGYILGKPGTANEGIVAGFEFTVSIRRPDGTVYDHVIGNCANVPLAIRQQATLKDENGQPYLDPTWYGRVATLNGQNISARSMALTHATISCWRPDKDPSGCAVWDEEELKSLIF